MRQLEAGPWRSVGQTPSTEQPPAAWSSFWDHIWNTRWGNVHCTGSAQDLTETPLGVAMCRSKHTCSAQEGLHGACVVCPTCFWVQQSSEQGWGMGGEVVLWEADGNDLMWGKLQQVRFALRQELCFYLPLAHWSKWCHQGEHREAAVALSLSEPQVLDQTLSMNESRVTLSCSN